MLTKINNRCYVKLHRTVSFTFKLGTIGMGSAGKCWRLNMLTQGVETVIACFVIHDDGHRCYEEYSCDNKLWTTTDARDAAIEMIDTILSDA